MVLSGGCLYTCSVNTRLLPLANQVPEKSEPVENFPENDDDVKFEEAENVKK